MYVKISIVLLVACLAGYGFVATIKVSDYSDLADEYYEQYCITEYFISKANPSDPVVLELQRTAKRDKICDGFELSEYSTQLSYH